THVPSPRNGVTLAADAAPGCTTSWATSCEPPSNVSTSIAATTPPTPDRMRPIADHASDPRGARSVRARRPGPRRSSARRDDDVLHRVDIRQAARAAAEADEGVG